MKKVTMPRPILSAKAMRDRMSKFGHECWGEIMLPLNNKLMKISKNLMSEINSNINLKEKVCEVDVPIFYFLVSLKEIDIVDFFIKDNYNGGSKSVRGFIFEGDPQHENVELKPVLFRHQCYEKLLLLAHNKLEDLKIIWYYGNYKNC